MSWYLQVLKKYAVFSGRARRKEYWYFYLANGIIGFGLGIIDTVLGLPLLLVFSGRARRKEYWYFYLANGIIGFGLGIIDTVLGLPLLLSLYYLAVLLPTIGVSVRRLHDTGRSGWWILIVLIPLIGAIILLIYMVSDSQEGTSQYGPSPKLVEQ